MAIARCSRIIRILNVVNLVVFVATVRGVLAAPNRQETTVVEMRDFTFMPRTLTVPVGATVTWTNNDPVIHTSTQDTGAWDSGDIAAGASFSFTFEEAGSFPYYCKPHGQPGGNGMTGTIVVTAAQAEATVTATTEEPTATAVPEPTGTATTEAAATVTSEPATTAIPTAAAMTPTATTGTDEVAVDPPAETGPSGATLALIGILALVGLGAGLAFVRRSRRRVVS